MVGGSLTCKMSVVYNNVERVTTDSSSIKEILKEERRETSLERVPDAYNSIQTRDTERQIDTSDFH